MYQLDFIAILEPCISGPNADKVINKIGLDGCFRVDANGFLGGNWCLWRTSGTNISVMGSFPYHVHLHINPKLHKPWFLTIFCVIPQSGNHIVLWDELRNINSNMNSPWLVAGDFNIVLFQHEKQRSGHMNMGDKQAFDGVSQ